ncbi:zinc ABC transporter substrate-binding protein [Hyphomicrobium sp.]|jgi:zinc transport system substrate-binding protein|uniref:zinc ABC transporter substrate-binding protein n=1 Tax=Hyphomicrobium sp. TaxID=82 RepID=UPI002B57B3C0|nr:zinc ABC transporter substrate-binding protein [Hyphomicrobium sp.]HVZ03224.1 zinc ABC transporter substrate-binding protein [Hyphomicrobium sp.]
MAILRVARHIAGALLLLTLIGSSASSAEAPKVVVTIKPVHALVSQIMAGVGSPTLLVDGSASPHTFTLRPSTARAINDADVFIRISDSMEPFTRKIVQALPSNVTVVTLADSQGITLLDQRHGGTFEAHSHSHGAGDADDDDHDGHEEHADHHDETGKDGHIWLDPQNAKAIVDVVTKAVSVRYPHDASKFKANALALDRRLDALNQELAAELSGARRKPFIVFHDATQYFENRFGLTAAGSITVSPEVPPSARRLSEVRQKITSLGAVCVFSEPSFQPNLIAAVTEGTAARAGTLDAEGIMLTPGPELYFTLMRGLAHNLTHCLDMQS